MDSPLDALNILIAAFSIPIAVYILVRIGSAAYFMSRREYDRDLERRLLDFRDDHSKG